MHNAAFAALGEPHRYHGFHVSAAKLEAALVGARALGVAGLNLTVPHKQAAQPWVDVIAAEAERTSSINTLVLRDGRWHGHSTDGAGFVAGLNELGLPPRTHAVVLGGGGASCAVVDALLHLVPPCRVDWVSRDPEHLPDWSNGPMRSNVRRHGYDALTELLCTADLLVNGTTVGMRGGPPAFPIAIALETMRTDAAVIDIVYPRPEGGLLDRATALGLHAQDGLPMLLWQGVRAQELWRGGPLPQFAIEAMRSALYG